MREVRIPTLHNKVRIPTLRRTIPELYRFLLRAEHIYVVCSSLRIVGGIVVIVTRTDYLETCPDFKGQLEPLMEKLEMEGKWKKLKRDVGAMYYLDKEAVCYKYEVLADSK